MTLNTGNCALDAKINEWFSYDKNENTISEVELLLSNNEFAQLETVMLNRLAFGTAGLRGTMGAGFYCMNDVVIIQTSQGLAKYLKSVNENNIKKGIVIGYDGRHNSLRFSHLVAATFLLNGFKVYLYDKIVPTPFVPFCVLRKKTAAGVMITASHNPKEDNGYKVYWDNGSQIIPPHDVKIQSSIEQNLLPDEAVWMLADKIIKSGHENLSNPLSEIYELYFSFLRDSTLNSTTNATTPLKFVVTSMHGVSHRYMVEAFNVCGFKPFIPVKEQMEADPEFPTVRFPNPEEGKSALDLSIKTANDNGASVILANDPDADRLAVAEKLPSGEWRVFSGNEEGALLGWWAWFRCRQLNPTIDPSDIYMVASTVSSIMLKSISIKEGFNFEETLTGFKWMGNKAHELINKGKTVLFAFEEAIGFMDGTQVLDKDGISAAIRMAEMAAYLKLETDRTLNDQLKELYKIYGYHCTKASYYICLKQHIIAKMFNRLRNYEGNNVYPTSLGKGKFPIASVRDLTTGFDSATVDNQTVLPASTDSQMITFRFKNGCIITMRTSGTEPKIKYYSEMHSLPESLNWDELKCELYEVVDCFVEEFLQPDINKLIPKTD